MDTDDSAPVIVTLPEVQIAIAGPIRAKTAWPA